MGLRNLFFIIIIILLIIICYIKYLHIDDICEIHCKKSELNNYILKNSYYFNKGFNPPFLYKNRHVQMGIRYILLKSKKIEFKRDLIKLPDGGTISLDWVIDSLNKNTDKIILIFHGIGMGSSSMKFIINDLLKQNYIICVYNRRGYENTKLTTNKMPHNIDISDTDFCIKHIKNLYKTKRIYAVGFSAGTIYLISYLGKTKEKSLLELGVCICPCYNIKEDIYNTKANRYYLYFLGKKVKNLIIQNKEILNITDNEINNMKNISDYINFLYKYNNNDKNIYKYNSDKLLSNVKVPLLLISSLDDPVCNSDIPYTSIKKNNNLMLYLSNHGAHGCYITQNFKLYCNDIIIDYLNKYNDFSNLLFK